MSTICKQIMILLNLLLSSRSTTKFWTFLVFLFVAALGYLGYKLTRGYSVGYLKSNINERWKGAFLLIQGFSSVTLALILPNNYLVDIDFIRRLYDENELWIPASIVTLLFLLLIVFGLLFTLIGKGLARMKDRSASDGS
jgi:hypothetical protein